MMKRVFFMMLTATLVLFVNTRANADTIALYDFEPGGSGENFDQPGNDSADTDPNTSASRLTTGGLDGGGANNIFNTSHPGSDSGPPVSNWGNGNLAEADANFAAFTITPEPGVSVIYDSLSLFHGSYNGTGSIKITYAIGAGPEVEALPPTDNTAANGEPLTQAMADFPDFTTAEVVTWKIHVFGTDGANTGTRLDDITINGSTVVPEPASVILAAVAILGLAVCAWRRRK